MQRLISAARFHGEPRWLAFVLFLSACAPADVVEITILRQAENFSGQLEPGGSGQLRFGGSSGMAAPRQSDAPKEPPFAYQTPQGWEVLEPTEMRIINLRPAGDERMECSMVVLGGDGGGVTANINRWRKQIGLEPISEEQVDALPGGLLLGQNAKIVDLRGSYSGMSDSAQEDWGLYGYILVAPKFTVFTKMTGPGELVAAQRANFQDFCASIAVSTMQQHGPDDGHDHGPDDGHDHGDSADPHAAVQTPSPGTVATETGDFAFDMPEGWSTGPASSMRVVNLLVGQSQCYIILLGGDGGGLAGNINRWRGEVGMDPASSLEIQSMPKVEILGESVPLLEVTGDYQGMGGPGGNAKRVLGVALIRPGKSVFVKMVGPDAEVAAQRDAFIAFVNSLSER